MLKMKKRPLGHSGIEVSEIGFGAWQLGNEKDWGKMTDEEAIHLVEQAMDEDCTFFDTAPNYGAGKSEELIGKAVRGKRDQVVISSKGGHHSNGELNFEPEQLRLSVESSLRRLQTDYLDCLLLHNPPFSTLTSESPQFELLEQLKAEGKIKSYGASVDTGKEVTELIKHTDSQVIEVMFNMFHQEPAESIKLAYQQGVGIIAKIPLDSGWLTGKYDRYSKFSGIRDRWSKEEIQRRARLVEKVRLILGEERSMVQAALQYVLSFEEVSTTIPGARNIAQLQHNISASEGELSMKVLNELHKLWEEEISGSKLPW
ncbi:aldo/keto reductase [Exiguobacterium sp. SH0S2]|uniref:aldo/keto reductase n=1 Tax=Exiguobacterium sp. SH0S2 TaxID=2510950 RepID=UPI001F1E16A6|nr:aldo/keto reductase [Exiguobacterium sp. SH0S2]